METNRILDSCRDRDCYENVRVFLTDLGQEIIEHTSQVRVKDACIAWTYIGIDPVQFNRGFYSVTIKFYVSLTFEACVPMGQLQEFEGVAVIEKRVVLYGGESNVNVFRSAESENYCAMPELVSCAKKNPEAVVEVLEPIVLGARIVDCAAECHCCCCCCDIPSQICCQAGGLVDGNGDRFLVVSLGFFSVIRLVRAGQFLISASEYCLPEKECSTPCEDNPCATFGNIPFPAAEFCGASPIAPAVSVTPRRCCN
jgi:hypothetical protein